jgi:hypothetical protein
MRSSSGPTSLWLAMGLACVATVGLVVTLFTGGPWIVVVLEAFIILGLGVVVVLRKAADRQSR